MPSEFDKTLNLPKTEFPMRANLPNREKELYKKQDKENLYKKIMDKNSDKPLYILHDGPPYANGKIHLGTALNKILKDFIIKQKNMSGHKAPFVPGWDTHGLPIELQALKAAGKNKNNLTSNELRKMCKEFAILNVNNQIEQFKELGVIGDFDNPYLTLNKDYEARQIEIFGEMAKKGYIYKGLKPVYWCRECGTALAEAEIEYDIDSCQSIYVKFAVKDDKGVFSKYNIDKNKINFVIWTTTTWTLPGNVAVCLGKKYDYSLIKANDEYYIIAKDLLENTLNAANITSFEEIATFKGSELEYITLYHPFLDRESLVILGDHVTLESGTGCVHTAPGHGVEDYEVCKNYKELEILVPVDEKGILNEMAGKFQGLSVEEANKEIADELVNSNRMFAQITIEHQYPHCWRCKQPILFRATEQWFCSVEDFKDEALEAIKNIKWIPSWGENRIENMVKDRSDWCISRQRKWGVPIPILYCKKCKKPIINSQTIEHIAKIFKEEGSDSWFSKDASYFVPNGLKCECKNEEFYKENDIMDVWFDSGCSHASVLKDNEELRWPADLYLEGADQYRGWFQSSLLTAVATDGKSPYKEVCTNGWVVDGEGRKMSKSLANGVAPEKIISTYGADILRLWVASSDYHCDIRISNEILKQLSEVYRKIRNTSRFILGNLGDFDPNKDMISLSDLEDIDKWAIIKINELIKLSDENYNSFSFYNLYHAIHNFCVIDMSNFYLDIIKDRLYCDSKDGQSRKSAQSAIYLVLSAFCRILAPLLTFTAEEIWSFIPHFNDDNTESVLLNDMPKPYEIENEDEVKKLYDKIKKYRDIVTKELEEKRANKEIGASLEANVTIYAKKEDLEFLSSHKKELKDAFIVSNLDVTLSEDEEFKYKNPTMNVKIEKLSHSKCERCWTYSEEVGKDDKYKTLCKRCASVIKNENESEF